MERKMVLDDLKYAIKNHQKFYIKERSDNLIIGINNLVFVIPRRCYEVFNSQIYLNKYIDSSIEIPWIEYILKRKDMHCSYDEIVTEIENKGNGITVLKSKSMAKSVKSKYLKYFNNPYFYMGKDDSMISVYEKEYNPKEGLEGFKTPEVKPEDLFPVGLIPSIV